MGISANPLTVSEYKKLMHAGTEDEYQVSKFFSNMETVQCDVFIHGEETTAIVSRWEGEGEDAEFIQALYYEDANVAIASYRAILTTNLSDWAF